MGVTIILFEYVIIAWALKNPNLPYAGQYVDSFKAQQEGGKTDGHLYIVNKTHLFVHDFVYDGDCADSYFWVGKTNKPDSNGKPFLSTATGRKSHANILLKLPADFEMKGSNPDSLKYVAFWCKETKRSLSTISVPSITEMAIPLDSAPAGAFTTVAHGVTAKATTILNSRTIKLEGFSYDGKGKGVGFYVGLGTWDSTGSVLSPRGVRERAFHSVPVQDKWQIYDDNCKMGNLGEYKSKDIVLHIGDAKEETIIDIDFISVYSKEDKQSYGHVVIPLDLRVQPHMDGTCTKSSPQNDGKAGNLRPTVVVLAAIVLAARIF